MSDFKQIREQIERLLQGERISLSVHEQWEIAKSLKALLRVAEAARGLCNEIAGMLGIERHAIAELVSETNVRCLENKLVKTSEALEQLQERSND